MKLKEILNMEYYLKNECYCPGEIYSADGFFYEIFKGENECIWLGECEIENNFLSKLPFIAVVSESSNKDKQILLVMYECEEIQDILRFDATENNIKLIKEVIKNNTTNLKFSEYEEGKIEKSLKEIFEIADAILIS